MKRKFRLPIFLHWVFLLVIFGLFLTTKPFLSDYYSWVPSIITVIIIGLDIVSLVYTLCARDSAMSDHKHSIRVIILKYRDFKKYHAINPDRYSIKSRFACIRYDDNHFDYNIYFRNIISYFLAYNLVHKADEEDDINTDLRMFYESVQTDIDKLKEKADKDIAKALEDQNKILKDMKKELTSEDLDNALVDAYYFD